MDGQQARDVARGAGASWVRDQEVTPMICGDHFRSENQKEGRRNSSEVVSQVPCPENGAENVEG